jgi:protein ImuB
MPSHEWMVELDETHTRFLTDRLTRTQSEPATQPDVLRAVTASGKGGNRPVAVNVAAEAIGLKPGMLLTEATAIAPDLRATPQDAPQEAAHLKRLALWCRRYTPWVAPDAPDCLRLDIAGAAHLFGGEATLLRDIRGRFMRAGFFCRAAIADTPAAAWAMAHHATASLSIVSEGEQHSRLSPLPIRALRIEEDKAAALDRLGLKTIGQLFDLPPQLRARFGAALCARLDQALGIDIEAQTSLCGRR